MQHPDTYELDTDAEYAREGQRETHEDPTAPLVGPTEPAATKECTGCGCAVPLTGFYANPLTRDGLKAKCKTCVNAYMSARERVKRQDPAWVEAQQARGREKHQRLYKGLKRKKSPESDRRWKDQNPEKLKAHCAVADLRQRLTCPGNHLHHWSYRAEHHRDVIEVTAADHAALHRYIIYDKAEMMYRRKDTGELLNTRAKHEALIEMVLFPSELPW